MDRQVGRIAQRLEQCAGRSGLQQSGHVLDGDDVRAGGLQFFRQANIIFQVVLGPRRVQNVAGIADRRFAELSLGNDCVHGDAHVLDPVQAVENAEKVDAASSRLADEMLHHIVGIVGVADAVGAAQQHLQQQIWRSFAHFAQPFPRILGQEAHGDIEGRAAPALQRQKLRQRPCVDPGDAGNIMRAHARGEQRLMPVAHRRVRHQHLCLFAHPRREPFRAERVEKLLRAAGNSAIEIGHDRGRRVLLGHRPAARLGMAVDTDVGEVVQELGRAVLALDLREQFRRRVDEPRRIAAVAKARVVDDRLEEGEVGRHAADAEFAQRAVHAGYRLVRRRRPGSDLLQQRIVETRDDRARIGGAAVEADAETGRAAIGGDAAVVRDEIVLGILGGDAALQGVAVQPDVGLRRNAGLGRADGETVEDVDLRLDDVDAGHLLGDGVLDLDARIDLDEVEIAGVGILQEFDGAGSDVAGGARDVQRVAAEFVALRRVEVGRRRALHDLLVAALDRAIALEEMHGVAVAVAEDLHLDMTCAFDQLFEIDLVLAEGGFCLALALGDLAGEIGFGTDGAHAAAAAAP